MLELVKGIQSSTNSFRGCHYLPKLKGLYIWRLAHDRLQTMDNLERRNIINDANDLNCVFFSGCVQTSRHLFFECRVSCYVWNYWYSWYGEYDEGYLGVCLDYLIFI